MRTWPNYFLERQLWVTGARTVAGVDEVGVGALAGPVTAAAVILAPDAIIEGAGRLQMLTPKRARRFSPGSGKSPLLCHRASRGGGLNVYWAAMEARRRAVETLPTIPGHVLVDGKRQIRGCRLAQTPVVDGDALSASIAAASIVAKVTRDA
jgi:ribonuclease HII